ncbi:hypothetical protein E2C01_098858 [Portunus trituberculatus]|uniref:Uncharacterized protein n=1 Tax=Portunus trituberculatus TaxID=210409 RepID=A0A5B7K405_PORTR|nr:hypothetical protein [Portunus trituberculatus]
MATAEGQETWVSSLLIGAGPASPEGVNKENLELTTFTVNLSSPPMPSDVPIRRSVAEILRKWSTVGTKYKNLQNWWRELKNTTTYDLFAFFGNPKLTNM